MEKYNKIRLRFMYCLENQIEWFDWLKCSQFCTPRKADSISEVPSNIVLISNSDRLVNVYRVFF